MRSTGYVMLLTKPDKMRYMYTGLYKRVTGVHLDRNPTTLDSHSLLLIVITESVLHVD